MSNTAEQKASFIKEHGPWTAACIHLGEANYTFDPPQVDTRLRRILQVAADIVNKPLEKTRVLDLACLEAQFGIEFALHGADVIGIEGREANLKRCHFVRNLLCIKNISFLKDDVRNISVKKYGHFDIVLCLGILYHLNTPDVMEFVKNIFDVSSRIAIIETHISPSGETSYNWKGREYHGSYYTEHDSDDWKEQESKVWSSMHNKTSFKFTLPSLCNLLRHVGFSSIYQCMNPYEYHNPDWPSKPMGDKHVVEKNRVTLVAIKGQIQTLLSSPVTEQSPEIDRPEIAEYQGFLPQPGTADGKLPWMRQLLPNGLRSVIPERAKRVLRRYF
jgi:hypothetical protein